MDVFVVGTAVVELSTNRVGKVVCAPPSKSSLPYWVRFADGRHPDTARIKVECIRVASKDEVADLAEASTGSVETKSSTKPVRKASGDWTLKKLHPQDAPKSSTLFSSSLAGPGGLVPVKEVATRAKSRELAGAQSNGIALSPFGRPGPGTAPSPDEYGRQAENAAVARNFAIASKKPEEPLKGTTQPSPAALKPSPEEETRLPRGEKAGTTQPAPAALKPPSPGGVTVGDKVASAAPATKLLTQRQSWRDGGIVVDSKPVPELLTSPKASPRAVVEKPIDCDRPVPELLTATKMFESDVADARRLLAKKSPQPAGPDPLESSVQGLEQTALQLQQRVAIIEKHMAEAYEEKVTQLESRLDSVQSNKVKQLEQRLAECEARKSPPKDGKDRQSLSELERKSQQVDTFSKQLSSRLCSLENKLVQQR